MSIGTQILIGSLIIAVSVFVFAVFMAVAISVLDRIKDWHHGRGYVVRVFMVIGAGTLWLVAGISTIVWLWAACFVLLDAFDSWEPAVYFALVTVTTLGFGDVILGPEARLLSGMAAANGLILFGLTTAILVEILKRMRRPQNR